MWWGATATSHAGHRGSRSIGVPHPSCTNSTGAPASAYQWSPQEYLPTRAFAGLSLNGSRLAGAVGAAVIGGTSLFGGKGRIVDAILGGLVVAVIQNGLPLVTQKSGIQFIVTGLVLLLAASVDAISRRRSAATGR